VRLLLILIQWAVASSFCLAGASTQLSFELQPGENRVVFVGNGFIEQARLSGYIEARLLRHSPERPAIFRNLGWSGDSVSGAARTAGYENPAGLDRLVKEAAALKPSAIYVGYGMVESFEGESGLSKFKEGYNLLLDALQRITPKLVLLSPTFREVQGPSSKDAPDHNHNLERYTSAIATIAANRKLPFVDLFHPLSEFEHSHPATRLTSNGITLNDSGYWLVAFEIERQLGLAAEPCRIEMTADGKVVSAQSAVVSPSTAEVGLQFKFMRQNLPAPAAPDEIRKAGSQIEDSPWLQVKGLSDGDWTLTIDGKEMITAKAEAWATGIKLPVDPDKDAAEKLRNEIIRSNEIFYRRWRPFNDHSRHWTYISGDYALYDQQLADLDKVIATLRKPVSHDFKLSPKQVKP
jgi:lysophospholipase L1-like esterase